MDNPQTFFFLQNRNKVDFVPGNIVESKTLFDKSISGEEKGGDIRGEVAERQPEN